MISKNLNHEYINNAEGIRSLNASKVDYAFGMYFSFLIDLILNSFYKLLFKVFSLHQVT
jgi:hypothetical protein